jgi:Icc-related predicted phosphoesterase
MMRVCAVADLHKIRAAADQIDEVAHAALPKISLIVADVLDAFTLETTKAGSSIRAPGLSKSLEPQGKIVVPRQGFEPWTSALPR